MHLIPLCHPLLIDRIDVRISQGLGEGEEVEGQRVEEGWGVLCVECEVKCSGKTGVEMEALVGASVAALTCYDMLKAKSHHIRIADTRLISKEGGKSPHFHHHSSSTPP